MGPMGAPRREGVARGEARAASEESCGVSILKPLRRRWWSHDEPVVVGFAATRIRPRRSRYPELKPPLRSEAALGEAEVPRRSRCGEFELHTAKQMPKDAAVAMRRSLIRRRRNSKWQSSRLGEAHTANYRKLPSDLAEREHRGLRGYTGPECVLGKPPHRDQ